MQGAKGGGREVQEMSSSNCMPDFVPIYETTQPDEPIVIRETEKLELIVGTEKYVGKGSVILRFIPRPGLIIQGSFVDTAGQLFNMIRKEEVLLRFPTLDTESEVLTIEITPAPRYYVWVTERSSFPATR
jgi:hypothetical protein